MRQIQKLFLSAFILTFLTISSGNASQLPERVRALFQSHEQQCIQNGWQKLFVNIRGNKRKVLFKKPNGKIKGAIIVLHGGGGSYSNYCANIWLGKPMVDFSSLALKEGFAVFSLDSGWNSFTDENGNACGKRWASVDLGRKPNPDLDFIKTVATQIIPSKLQDYKRKNIFISGISNGGYMAILSSVHLTERISAFAPVSAGNPYSIRIDCKRRPGDRPSAPGRFFHKSGTMISYDNSCSDNHIKLLPKKTRLKAQRLPFKQFHHEDDRLVDLSCMKEAQRFLRKNGYQDDGAFIASNAGGKRIWKHFWLSRYNELIIDFFKSHAK